MIELRGKREEIALAVKGIAPEWPVQLIEQLEPGEWHFVLNGVNTKVFITPEFGGARGGARGWKGQTEDD